MFNFYIIRCLLVIVSTLSQRNPLRESVLSTHLLQGLNLLHLDVLHLLLSLQRILAKGKVFVNLEKKIEEGGDYSK